MVTADLTTEGRQYEKEDKGKGEEESGVYSQPIQVCKILTRQRKVREVENTTRSG